jgi:hypothetical protein
LRPARYFKVFGKAFIEPQRNIGHDCVEVSVSDLMPQVLGHAVTPMSQHDQLGIVLNE